MLLRRSRGYVPAALPLPGGAARPLLACGAELKNTFCVAKGERAWVSHHIGDLENYETLRSFTEGVEHFERLFAVTPEVVAHDLHPEYLSTKYALERDGVELIGVQHHHAHLAACLAEHAIEGHAVGAIYDGTVDGDVASWKVDITRPLALTVTFSESVTLTDASALTVEVLQGSSYVAVSGVTDADIV